MASPGHLDEEGRGHAGREGGGVVRRSARASGTRPPPVGEEDDRGGGTGGPGRPTGPARPHSAGPAQELSAR